MNKSRGSSGLLRTLIWILFAVAVAVILAVVVLGVGGPTHNHAGNRVEAEIKAMEAGLESYKADHGDYPTGTNLAASPMGNNAFLFLALNGTNGSGKVYVEFSKNQTNASGNIVDPFGNIYCYQYPGATNRSGTNFPDLYSVGKNPANTNGWTMNW